jgi:AraC-like DNA-binding protein
MRSEATGTFSVLIARVAVMAAAAQGMPPPDFCARFGLDPLVLADIDARLPVSDVVAIWEQLPALLGDEDFGLHAAELGAAAPQGLAGQMIAASTTLGEGLRRLVRFERVFHDVRTSQMVLDGDTASIIHDTRGGLSMPRHGTEFVWAYLLLMARRITGAPITPLRLELPHPAPARSDEHVRVLGVRPSFGCAASRLTVARSDLDRPSRTADAALAEILDSHARGLLEQLPTEPDLLAQVRAAAHAALSAGELTVKHVARRLGISPRTLQRRLADEHGTSFQMVVDDLRADLARRWLGDRNIAIGEVAFALGFAEQSAFHRAFVRWTGITPGQFRNQRT